MHWRPGTGVESPFPNYTLDGKTISSGKVTTLSEFSIVSENRVTKIDHDTPSVLCKLGCSLTTAFTLSTMSVTSSSENLWQSSGVEG